VRASAPDTNGPRSAISFLAPMQALIVWANANHQSICNDRLDYAEGEAA
jgi:hypothetical protein